MTERIKPINIRLKPESELIYRAEAKSKNLPLRTYLRQILEERLKRGDGGRGRYRDSDRGGDEAKSTRAMFIEMLLLMRQISQHDSRQLAQGEVERLGYEIWTADYDYDNSGGEDE